MSSLERRKIQVFAEAACQTMRTLLEQPDLIIAEQHAEILKLFFEAADGDESYRSYGEIARSVANLISGQIGQFIDPQTFIQILAVGPAFVDALSNSEYQFNTLFQNPLVPPISPSAERPNSECIVLTDNDAFYCQFKKLALENDFAVRRIDSIAALLNLNSAQIPAAIVADLHLVEREPRAKEILARLKTPETLPPHLIVLGDPKHFAARLLAVRLGATRFFPNPPDIDRIVHVLKGVTARTPSKPYRALMVDDDRTMAPIYEKALSKAGMTTTLINNPMLAMPAISDFSPDVIVTDLLMNDCNGLELISVIRQDDSLVDTPIFMLTSDSDPKKHIEALHRGADVCMIKPVPLPIFITTVSAHAKKSRRLKRTRHDIHQFFAHLHNRNLPGDAAAGEQARLKELQQELLPPELIPAGDYIVSENV